MCFSAQASFAAGAVLLPAGAFCVRAAVRQNHRFLPLALVPLAFAAQQLDEGLVWLGLEQGNASLVQWGSAVFLFFALAFWPFWIPLSLWFPETRRAGKHLLAGLTVLSLVWAWLYFPMAAEPGRWLSTEIVAHSVRYQFGNLPGFQVVPRAVWRGAYLLAICVPLLACRPVPGAASLVGLAGGGLVAVLFAVSYFVFWYAFTSVWCFFAALLSLFLCLAFWRLPSSNGGGTVTASQEPPGPTAP
jgi:uncharacterized protein DUF6629